jgi:predicted enzyme related to lactoylglutathione lyase
MPYNLQHFSIEADDLGRARRFYESVFGWQFRPWGPPDYFLIRTGTEKDPGVQGDLTRRRAPLTGTGTRGFECTIAVDSIEKIMKKITENGGKIVLEPYVIVGVGTLIYFHDTEGNRVGAMQQDTNAK